MIQGKGIIFFLLFIFGGVVLGFAGLTTMIVDYIIITNTHFYPNFFFEFFGFLVFYIVFFIGLLFFLSSYSEEKE